MIHTSFDILVSPKLRSPNNAPQPVSGESTALINDPSNVRYADMSAARIIGTSTMIILFFIVTQFNLVKKSVG